MSAQLDAVILLKAIERLHQPVLAIARDRPRLLRTVRIKLAARDSRPLPPPPAAQHRTGEDHRLQIDLQFSDGLVFDPPALALSQPPSCTGQRPLAAVWCAKRLRQLITAIRSVELILSSVDLLGLAQDLTDELAVVAILIHRRAGLDLDSVDRDHTDRHQPRFPAQPQHLVKQFADLGLVATTELRDRGVIRTAHPGDHLERHILVARPLDPPRGPDPARVGVSSTATITAGS